MNSLFRDQISTFSMSQSTRNVTSERLSWPISPLRLGREPASCRRS